MCPTERDFANDLNISLAGLLNKLCIYVWFLLFSHMYTASRMRALVTVSCCLYDNMNPSVMSPKKDSKIQLIIPQPPATCRRMTFVWEISGYTSQQHCLAEGLINQCQT